MNPEPANATNNMPQQANQSSANVKSPLVLTMMLSILALVLPLLGLVVLHIFTNGASGLLPIIGSNLFLLIAVILCWIAIKKRGLRKSIPIVVAAVIGICLYIFAGGHAVNSTKYSYADTGSNFSTVQAGGMSFSKPTQFTETAKKSGQNFSTASFAHLLPSGYPVGYIFTFSYKDSHTNDKKYVSGVNDFMDGRVNNDFRTQYIAAIKKQVFDSYPGYSATLGEPQKFTNANIKSNAWSFDLDVTNDSQQVKPMKGKLIYVLGNGTIYYFALMITENNWTPNMATWQTVLGSLKL